MIPIDNNKFELKGKILSSKNKNKNNIHTCLFVIIYMNVDLKKNIQKVLLTHCLILQSITIILCV